MRIGLLLICLMFQLVVAGQKLTPVAATSSFKFTIKNFGLTVQGQFTGVKGEIVFDPAQVDKALFNISLDASSINTGNNSRDKHLIKEDYFNVARFPLLTFRSIRISLQNGNYQMEGNLTIKGVTRRISFPFSALEKGNNLLFSGQFKLNRRDFKVGGYSPVLADELIVLIQLSGERQL